MSGVRHFPESTQNGLEKKKKKWKMPFTVNMKKFRAALAKQDLHIWKKQIEVKWTNWRKQNKSFVLLKKHSFEKQIVIFWCCKSPSIFTCINWWKSYTKRLRRNLSVWKLRSFSFILKYLFRVFPFEMRI